MEIYRITRCDYINDLSGYGASQYPGRWNSKGVRMLYTAQSASLAILETVVHIGGLQLSSPYCMIVLDIPEKLISILEPSDLPLNWKDYPAPDSLKIIGDNFIKANKFPALRVPSAIVQVDFNYLVNPLHYNFKFIKVVHTAPFSFDGRLMK